MYTQVAAPPDEVHPAVMVTRRPGFSRPRLAFTSFAVCLVEPALSANDRPSVIGLRRDHVFTFSLIGDRFTLNFDPKFEAK
jgi:hypothetical protein